MDHVTVGGALLSDGSRAPAGVRVIGEFVAEFSPETGLARVEMLESSSHKSASQAVPAMFEELRNNEDETPVDGRVRFLQDASGNGQTVGACEVFWNNGWDAGDPSWPFWVPAPARSDFLDSLAGDVFENRFCTNFRLINDVGRPLRDVWIVVDGVTIPGVRAWVQDVPRVIVGEGGEPDQVLEPYSLQGTFRYGDFAQDEEVVGQWYFYFGGADVADFRVQGRIVEIVREQCGTGNDDNGDGIIDSGCATVPVGGGCFMNADCASLDCVGGQPGEPGQGLLGTCSDGPPPLEPGIVLPVDPLFGGEPFPDGEAIEYNTRDGAVFFSFDAFASVENCPEGCELVAALGLHAPETHHISASNACVELSSLGTYNGGTMSFTSGLELQVSFPVRVGVYDVRLHLSEPDESCADLRARIPALESPDAGTTVGTLEVARDPLCIANERRYMVSNVHLDNVQRETITVGPGAGVQVQADWSVKNNASSCTGCVTQLGFYFAGEPGVLKTCPYNGIPMTSCPGNTGTTSFSVTAPTTPGVYPLYWKRTLDFSCNALGGNIVGGRNNFATIVVE